jgi:RTX calcium-binding nonapeptide repeat (4 copies)
MPRILLTAAVTIAAAVAVPTVAHGATLHQDGRTPHRVLLQDATGETNLVSVEGGRAVVMNDTNAPITVADVPPCMPLDAYTVSCSAAVRRVDLDLGIGPDVAVINTPLPVSLEGGAGNDRYVAAATDARSRVDFDGGIGLDVANYAFATAGVDVSVDLEPTDGRPGDEDRIRRDVETVFGSQFADVLTGSSRTLQLAGMDGDDRITGGSGAEILSGGPGNDRIDARDGAADSIDCGGQTLDWAAVDVGVEAAIAGCTQVVS